MFATRENTCTNINVFQLRSWRWYWNNIELSEMSNISINTKIIITKYLYYIFHSDTYKFESTVSLLNIMVISIKMVTVLTEWSNYLASALTYFKITHRFQESVSSISPVWLYFHGHLKILKEVFSNFTKKKKKCWRIYWQLY